MLVVTNDNQLIKNHYVIELNSGSMKSTKNKCILVSQRGKVIRCRNSFSEYCGCQCRCIEKSDE